MPTHQPGDEIDRDIVKQFKRDVNMTASELAHWLETDESRGVGQKDGSSESTGHRSGRRIVELLDNLSWAHNQHAFNGPIDDAEGKSLGVVLVPGLNVKGKECWKQLISIAR